MTFIQTSLKEHLIKKLQNFSDLEFLGQESESRSMGYGMEFVFHRLGVRFHRQKTLLHPFYGIPKGDMGHLKKVVLSEFAPNFIAGHESVLIYGEMYSNRPEVIFVQENFAK